MSNEVVMKEMYERFSRYSKPSKQQVRFLELYQNRDKLLPSELEQLKTVVKILQGIDEIAKHKKEITKLTKVAQTEQRKKENHIKILVGSGLINAILSKSNNAESFGGVLERLSKENFINEVDMKKITDFLKVKKDEQLKNN